MNRKKLFKENDYTNIQNPLFLLSESPEYQSDGGERIS